MKKPNFSGYEINVDNGTIFSLYRNRFIGHLHPKGYAYVTLHDDDAKQHTFRIHRLIWECVNGEIPSDFDIHHKDGDKLNNSIQNLELISRYEHNCFHKQHDKNPMLGRKASEATRLKMSKSHKGKRAIAVVQLTMNNEYIATYSSLSEASEKTGVSASNISTVMHNRMKHAGHFIWIKKDNFVI